VGRIASCRDCSAEFEQVGLGRPRQRCYSCQPRDRVRHHVCAWCLTAFAVINSNGRKVCSQACRDAARNARRPACTFCGLQPPKGRRGMRRAPGSNSYCSSACVQGAQEQRLARAAKERLVRDRRICAWCLVGFDPPSEYLSSAYRAGMAYCSTRCSGRARGTRPKRPRDATDYRDRLRFREPAHLVEAGLPRCLCGCGTQTTARSGWVPTHRPPRDKLERPTFPCMCGCGEQTYSKTGYRHDHQPSTARVGRRPCACGCGVETWAIGGFYIGAGRNQEHWRRVSDRPPAPVLTDAQRDAKREAKRRERHREQAQAQAFREIMTAMGLELPVVPKDRRRRVFARLYRELASSYSDD